MSEKDKKEDEEFYEFKIPKTIYKEFSKAIPFIQNRIKSNETVWKAFGKVIHLLELQAKEDKQELARVDNEVLERTHKVIEYFRNSKTFYFEPKRINKNEEVSFEDMIKTVCMGLSAIELLRKDFMYERDYCIRFAHLFITEYYKEYEIEKPEKHQYRFMVMSAYIALCYGFHITNSGNKKITNKALHQAARNAFRSKRFQLKTE